ncbi:hypothetical protein HY409_04215 [Candidatus Gottesmanbacteria bacterium]|nr:hypothetical protein [Candidatus Gottesmanbacteria bacterium]
MRDVDTGLRFVPDRGDGGGGIGRLDARIGHTIRAIVLCTKPESRKHIGMLRSIEQTGIDGVPIVAMKPNKINETMFNNALARSAHLIAALKALQTPKNPEVMLQAMLGIGYLPRLDQGVDIFVANDVMLDVERREGDWRVCNKPLPESTPAEIGKLLLSLFGERNAGPHGLIKARIRVGAAVHCPSTGRGIAGGVEQFFDVSPLDSRQIKTYVESQPLPHLLSANAACRWEDMVENIYAIDGIPRDDVEFSGQLDLLLRQAQGSLPEIGTLLNQRAIFDIQQSQGDLTSELRVAAKNVAPDLDVGSWNTWRPYQNPVM